MVERILALDPIARAREEAELARCFPRLPGLDVAQTVLLYARAFPEEIATGPFFESLRSAGKALVCPRVDRARRRLVLHRIDDPARDLIPGTLSIPEPRPGTAVVPPEAVDWVLVPGLAFDRRGYRLGRGAGHYDRLIPTLRPDVPTWALILDCQWIDDLPVEPHDVPVTGVVSQARRWSQEFRSEGA